ncbi:MAG: LysM peptidoglycan-binding domain-containing protein, partial [Elusimicrobia bacterium]|nr:LysM peptidoglycan-binding domain-containing protein [Candidatus Obscuribacterium magneticum]
PYGPTLNVGIFRQQKDIFNFIADMEYAKGGLFRFHPGFEFLFARGVLRPRIGYSPREKNGISNIAMGLGVYLSPVQVDVTYVVPTRTVTDNVGQFRASVTYRFGRPQFSEIYYDKALEQASQLDSRVLGLTVKEAELKASVAELEQKVRLAKEDLDNAKARVESLKDSDLLGQRDATIRQLRARVHDLEAQLGSERHQVKQLREEKATIRTHTVVAGDTLQSIAKQYYGDPNQWKKVYNANADKIDRGLPRPGEKLVIP